MRFQDLTGQKYGSLTVESYAGKKGGRTAWNCRCDCGNTTIVAGTHLKDGHTTSCGCQKYGYVKKEDLAGKQFGYWTVLKFAGIDGKQTMWECKCVCGNIRKIRAGSLKSGNSRSCGCKKNELVRKSGYTPHVTKTVEDKIGKRYGKLTVVSRLSHKPGKPVYWKCKCDCGNERIVDSYALNCGKAIQCKECSKPFSYRQRYPRIYRIWQAMKSRCFYVGNKRYSDYGGRNITVCEEWKNSIEAFVKWSLSNGYQDNLTIDRINVDGNYEPSNCRWVTLKKQANNTRKNVIIERNGESHSLSEWSEITGIDRSTLDYRFRHWEKDRDIFQKPLKQNKGLNGS